MKTGSQHTGCIYITAFWPCHIEDMIASGLAVFLDPQNLRNPSLSSQFRINLDAPGWLQYAGSIIKCLLKKQKPSHRHAAPHWAQIKLPSLARISPGHVFLTQPPFAIPFIIRASQLCGSELCPTTMRQIQFAHSPWTSGFIEVNRHPREAVC